MRSFIFIASLFRDTRFWSEVGSNALLLLADTTSVIALISHWLLSILCNVVLTCCQHTLSMIDGSYFLCGNGSSSESLVFISRYLSTYLFVSLMFKLFYTVLSGYVCYRKEKKKISCQRHLWMSFMHRGPDTEPPLGRHARSILDLSLHCCGATTHPHRIRLNIQLPERSRNDLFLQYDRLTISSGHFGI